MRGSVILAVILVSACRGGADSGFSGNWVLCVEAANSKPVCGVASVGASNGPALRYTAWYPFTFDLALDSIAELRSPPEDRCGSVLLDDERGISVTMAIACDGVVIAHDVGNLNAEFLDLRGDSLIGHWYQSCYSGCSARGTLRMIRQRQ